MQGKQGAHVDAVVLFVVRLFSPHHLHGLHAPLIHISQAGLGVGVAGLGLEAAGLGVAGGSQHPTVMQLLMPTPSFLHEKVSMSKPIIAFALAWSAIDMLVISEQTAHAPSIPV